MEKLIYLLWEDAEKTKLRFQHELLTKVAELLQRLDNCNRFTLCIDDHDVEPAKANQINNLLDELPSAVATIWVNSANESAALDACFQSCGAQFAGYLVTESEPLVSPKLSNGQRSEGMNQLVMLTKPQHLSYSEWLDIWLMSHTKVAIQTQSTYGYRQNVVIRSVTENAPRIDAIVEENFPIEAVTSKAAFYNAKDNELLQKRNEKALMVSCKRFIDFNAIDCLPTSEYHFTTKN